MQDGGGPVSWVEVGFIPQYNKIEIKSTELSQPSFILDFNLCP